MVWDAKDGRTVESFGRMARISGEHVGKDSRFLLPGTLIDSEGRISSEDDEVVVVGSEVW